MFVSLPSVLLALCVLAAKPDTGLDLKALLRPPSPGAWARYTLSGKAMPKSKEFYVAAVRQELVDGRPHLWLELTAVGDDGDSLSVMGLYPAGQTLDLEAKKVVLKIGGSDAQEVPANLVKIGAMLASRFGLGLDLDELAAGIRESSVKGVAFSPQGVENLSLAGKTVSARKLLVEDSQGRKISLWLSERVPFFSFVRADYEARSITLSDWGGKGAVSRIGANYHPFDLGDIMKRMLNK